jgi:hypothetical protein
MVKPGSFLLDVILMAPTFLGFGVFMLFAIYAPGLFAVGFVLYMVISVAMMRLPREVARLLAGLLKHMKCRPTARKEPYGWKWPGMFTLRWRKHPQTIGYLAHYRFTYGHVGGYVTKFSLGVLNTIRHPFYNRGGRMKNLFLIHEFPFDEQFAEEEDTVVYMNLTCRNVSSVSWANLHEIMPSMEYFRDPKAWNRLKGKHNHVPYVEPDDLSHTPWFEVTDSSGMRAARESRAARSLQSQKVKVAMLTGPKGTTSQTPMCPECDKPLKVDNEVGTCENGHSWDMKN